MAILQVIQEVVWPLPGSDAHLPDCGRCARAAAMDLVVFVARSVQRGVHAYLQPGRRGNRELMRTVDTKGESRIGQARILAVDDTASNLVALRALLEPLGHEVVAVESGAKAIACAAQSEFALVLLDAVMPEMDGFETLVRLRNLDSFAGTPVLLVTAYEPEAGILERALALGAVDYVPKPIAANLLRAKVEVFVSLYKRRLELRQRNEALAAKDRHIAILAHDLRAPLSTITMAAEILAERDQVPRDRKVVARILNAARRIERMTADLLDFARAGAGGLPITRVETDLAALCREAIDELGPAHPDRPIGLKTMGNLVGRWDRERLQQALSNLLVNAVKYGRGTIVVDARRSTDQTELSVWNDGDPIPAARLDRIFEPFERGQEGGVGLGLGLYVVREIARSHGGRVDVSSSAGLGTKLTIVLPVGPTPGAVAAVARA
jgi:signal transduction histidine kinase